MNRSVAAVTFAFAAVLSVTSVAYAADDSAKHFEIKAEPLADALMEFGVQSGLTVLAPTTLTAGKKAAAIRGDLAPTDALGRLLSDSGLTFSRASDGTIAIEAAASSGPVQHETAKQSAVEDDSTAQDLLQEVTVTGSRLSASFSAPTPVTTVSSDQLKQASPNDIATALAQLPALNDSTLSSQPASASAASGTNGQSLLNLRGLGVNRTLVLLDGQRLGSTNVQDSVDINMIPQSLLKRVDIVTGGASASYGSDAVAGVVNFILDTRFEGFKADVSAGTTTYGDATNGNVEIAFGKKFGDNVRLIVGANAFKQGGIGLSPTSRNWHDNPYVAYPNPVPGALPQTIVVPNARSDNSTFGGLITGVNGCKTTACQSIVNQQFGAGGVLVPFQQGAYPNGVNGGFASGGDGATVGYGISPSLNRQNVLAHAEVDVNANLTLFAEGIFDRTQTSFDGQWPYITATTQFNIFPNNAFLPSSLQQFFAANPTATSISMGRSMSDLGPQQVDSLEKVGRFSVGAKGNVNHRWTFDTSLAEQYSVFDLDIYIQKERNLYAAANSVISPTTGQPICASTLQGLDPGCVPANLFGPNAVSSAARDYINGTNRGDTLFRQIAFEANLRGDLGENFTLGAGPISIATGFAYHHDTADRSVDPLSNTNISCTGIAGCPAGLAGRYGAYFFYNPTPFYGWTSATEGYVEVGVPLLKDLPFVKSLSVDLAGRVTDYSISGMQDTWKLGLQWALNSSIQLRGTFSQDVRAPDVIELFNPGSATLGSQLFPSTTGTPRYQVSGLNFQTGNQNLQPEIAHTTTGGIVLTPTFIEGLQTSLDFYKIDVAHSIQQLTPQGVIDGCASGNTTYCGYITVNGAPVTTTAGITSATTGLYVTVPTANLGRMNVAGVDFETDYTHHVLGGTFTGRLVANYLLTENLPTGLTGCAQTQVLGAIGGCLGALGYPHWRGVVSGQYQVGGLGVQVQERVIDGGKADPWDIVGVSITRNDVPKIEYTDLNLSYTVGREDRGHVYFNVTNLFNRDPPVTITQARGSVSPTASSVYDILGRRFVLGYRLAF